MTCIVGVIDKKKDCVWLGADSLGSNGQFKEGNDASKIFKNIYFNNVVMGSTTTFRHIDLLKYSEELLPELDMYKNELIDHKYMVTKFIPRLHNLFQNGIYDESETDKGASFLFGYKNKLFRIQYDYSVLIPADGYSVVGCGRDSALGSLYATEKIGMETVERVQLALESAEHNMCGVQRPFKIINTLNEEEIIIT